ncbi:MAG: hypothetical protein QOE82_1222 [Thermoanaerobaculia bacterium]|nr:hypothetical protein [Thermoanaerobaculia bacterium]
MPNRARVLVVAVLICLTSSALFAQTVYYFKGDPADQANKVANDLASSTIGTATFDTSPPTGTAPVVQTGSPFTNEDYVGNPLGIYWSGAFSGTLTGVMDVKWYWSTLNPETIALGGAVSVSIFADPDYAADRGQPQRLIGKAIVPLTGISAAPTLIESLVPVNGTVSGTLLIQVVPQFTDSGNGINVYYNSTTTPSSFTFHSAPSRVPFPAAPQASGLPPRFSLFTPSAGQIASGLGIDAGEPSIGSNWITGNAMFQSFVTTFKVSFDDSCPTSPTSTWVPKQSPITGTESMDPILWTDSKVGRTIVSQLVLASTESLSAITDNDGDTWIPSHGAGIASGIDHQTVGGGPFHAPLLAGAFYPNAVYYCAQDTALANCALSLDGGVTYGPAVPIYISQQCGGLHGHVKVGPDGVAYVPNKDCGGQQAVVVSEDNGITWNVRKVPNSLAANSDPSVATSKNGRVYLGFADNDNHPVIAVSDDHGQNWHDVKDVGAAAGINNAVFAEVVAGDDNRAAFAFLGTKSIGSLQARTFPGAWYMYVATTYDGGGTWHLTNATPNDPVQRGPIWLKGGAEISRNLLDFNDMTIDKQGRMLVGYADGCVDACIQGPETARGNSYSAIASILRQTGGRRMFAEFDPAEPTAPSAPTVTVTRNGNLARVSWSEGNNGGSPITKYSVQRNGATIATTTATSYTDPTANATATYTYSVVATNAAGSSCGSNAVSSTGSGSSCALPGVTMMTDATGDGTAAVHAALDIQSVSIAEPYYADGSQKLVFTMKVASLASVPPASEWRILWNFPTTDAGSYYVEMHTDPSGVVGYEYGTIDLTDAVVTAVGQPHPLGALDAESSYSPDGTIRLVISTANIGNAVAGDILGGLLARTFITTGSILTTSRTAIDTASTPASYLMVGNGFCAPPVVTVIEDNDSRIAYSSGWHLAQDGNASAGHFRFASGKPKASLAFTVPTNQFGSITYNFAKSTKGGTAEVFLDGVSQGTINFAGPLGTMQNPQFSASFSQKYGPLQPGAHTLEIRGNGVTYLDSFALESSSSNASPASGPGATTSSTSTLSIGQELVSQITVPANAESVSVIVSAPAGMLVRAGLVGTTGIVLATADTASNGVATLTVPVTQGGIYLVKTLNLSLGPVSVFTATTPQLTR